MLYWILHEEFLHLLDEEFVHESTKVVVLGDAKVTLQYLIHAEAFNVVLFLLCSAMGKLPFALLRACLLLRFSN